MSPGQNLATAFWQPKASQILKYEKQLHITKLTTNAGNRQDLRGEVTLQSCSGGEAAYVEQLCMRWGQLFPCRISCISMHLPMPGRMPCAIVCPWPPAVQESAPEEIVERVKVLEISDEALAVLKRMQESMHDLNSKTNVKSLQSLGMHAFRFKVLQIYSSC